MMIVIVMMMRYERLMNVCYFSRVFTAETVLFLSDRCFTLFTVLHVY